MKGLITSLIKGALFSFRETPRVCTFYLQVSFSSNLHYFKSTALEWFMLWLAMVSTAVFHEYNSHLVTKLLQKLKVSGSMYVTWPEEIGPPRETSVAMK